MPKPHTWKHICFASGRRWNNYESSWGQLLADVWAERVQSWNFHWWLNEHLVKPFRNDIENPVAGYTYLCFDFQDFPTLANFRPLKHIKYRGMSTFGGRQLRNQTPIVPLLALSLVFYSDFDFLRWRENSYMLGSIFYGGGKIQMTAITRSLNIYSLAVCIHDSRHEAFINHYIKNT